MLAGSRLRDSRRRQGAGHRRAGAPADHESRGADAERHRPGRDRVGAAGSPVPGSRSAKSAWGVPDRRSRRVRRSPDAALRVHAATSVAVMLRKLAGCWRCGWSCWCWRCPPAGTPSGSSSTLSAACRRQCLVGALERRRAWSCAGGTALPVFRLATRSSSRPSWKPAGPRPVVAAPVARAARRFGLPRSPPGRRAVARPVGHKVWELSSVCTRRGRFSLGPVWVTSGDPFGIFRVSRKLTDGTDGGGLPADRSASALRPRPGRAAGRLAAGRPRTVQHAERVVRPRICPATRSTASTGRRPRAPNG